MAISKKQSEHEKELYAKGEIAYEIVKDGKHYRVTKAGLVPLDENGKPTGEPIMTGTQAQKKLKKKRKPKVKAPAKQ